MCAVAILYAVAMYIKVVGFILFSARMKCLGFRNGKRYVLFLLGIPNRIKRVMRNAMYTRDDCETIDSSLMV